MRPAVKTIMLLPGTFLCMYVCVCFVCVRVFIQTSPRRKMKKSQTSCIAVCHRYSNNSSWWWKHNHVPSVYGAFQLHYHRFLGNSAPPNLIQGFSPIDEISCWLRATCSKSVQARSMPQRWRALSVRDLMHLSPKRFLICFALLMLLLHNLFLSKERYLSASSHSARYNVLFKVQPSFCK